MRCLIWAVTFFLCLLIGKVKQTVFIDWIVLALLSPEPFSYDIRFQKITDKLHRTFDIFTGGGNGHSWRIIYFCHPVCMPSVVNTIINRDRKRDIITPKLCQILFFEYRIYYIIKLPPLVDHPKHCSCWQLIQILIIGGIKRPGIHYSLMELFVKLSEISFGCVGHIVIHHFFGFRVYHTASIVWKSVQKLRHIFKAKIPPVITKYRKWYIFCSIRHCGICLYIAFYQVKVLLYRCNLWISSPF